MESNCACSLASADVTHTVKQERRSFGKSGLFYGVTLTVSPNQGVSLSFKLTNVIREYQTMKKAYTRPNLTTYGSVQQLTKGNGTIAVGDSIVFSDLPNQPTVEAFGSVDLVIPDDL